MKKTIAALLLLVGACLFGLRISKKIVFKKNVRGYLKRAADANTVELASVELEKAELSRI